MISPFKKRAFGAPALCVCLALAASASAQEEPGQTRGPIPGVEAAAEYVPPPPEPVAPSERAPAEAPEAAAEAPAEAAEAPAAKMPWETATPVPAEAEEVPTPIVDEAAQPAVAEKKPAKPEKVKKIKEPREPRESSAFTLRCGARAALGISAFAGHKALTTSEDVPEAFAFIVDDEKFGLSLKPLVSASVGVAAEYDLSDIVDFGLPFSVAAEFQYTLYTAYSSARGALKEGYDFPRMYEVGVELHALELPILARVRYDIFYAEAGPQFGANVHAKAWANAELKRPILNGFAFGPALGVGVDMNGVLAGLRGYFDALEYAKNSKGRPWTLQCGVTVYP